MISYLTGKLEIVCSFPPCFLKLMVEKADASRHRKENHAVARLHLTEVLHSTSTLSMAIYSHSHLWKTPAHRG